jgi:hypothetical protein
MQDLDFSMAIEVKDLLQQYQIPYREEKLGSLIYVIVENNNDMAMFLFYGFFEEYVLYKRIDVQSDWILQFRGELNFNFTSVANVLSDIGIKVNETQEN